MTQRAAKEKLIKQYCKNRAWCELYGEHCKKENCEIYHAIKALEAEPIKNGHWIWTGKDRPGAPESIRCSECGFWYYKLMPHKYCSNCGAKMEDGENGK